MTHTAPSAGPVLVTGAAGFIGHAVSHRLIARGESVVGLDDFNAYYDPRLKRDRAATLAGAAFEVVEGDIADADALAALVRDRGVTRIVHLAAQAGVRHSIAAPFAYAHANLTGHLAVLEAARHAPGFAHLVYASSSSVYGAQGVGGAPLGEGDAAASPASLYAATKRSGELMSAAYANLYAIPQTGLRFFTVYGPWGRPDMAVFDFTRRILGGEEIAVFGEGAMARDFTYIDDIVDGVVAALDRPPAGDAPRILNIGSSAPTGLTTMVATLEAALGTPARTVLHPMQPGDVRATYADVSALRALTGYAPATPLAEGIARFVAWYRAYYRV